MPRVQTRRDSAILMITLDHPDRLNALDPTMLDELRSALAVAEDPGIRAVVVTGAGRGFCVGQDLAALEEFGVENVEALLEQHYRPVVQALRALEKPVIAAINGPIAGAGVSLAAACDLRLASSAATFVPAFVSIGLVPDAGGTFFLSRILGAARAYEWMTSGRVLKAEEALAMGFVSEVVEADEFVDRMIEVAADQAAKPTQAVALMKRLFDAAPTSSLDEQFAAEAQSQAAAIVTRDFTEGVAAFRQKRPPVFDGR